MCIYPLEGADKCFDRWLPWFSLTAEQRGFGFLIWVSGPEERLLKWAVVLGGKNEYKIMSTVPLRLKSAAVCVTYYCFSPCPTSTSLATLRFCCSPLSSSSLLLYFHFSFACYQPSLCPKATTLISEWGCEKEHWDAALFCSVLTSVTGGWAVHREENVSMLSAWGHWEEKGHWENVIAKFFLDLNCGMLRVQETLLCLQSCCFQVELTSACVLSLWRTTL